MIVDFKGFEELSTGVGLQPLVVKLYSSINQGKGLKPPK